MALGSGGLISVSIGGFGLQTRIRELATFGHSIETLAPAWEQVGEDFLQDFAQNFAQEGGFFGGTRSYLGAAGGKWKPLADSTQADRERHGYGREHPILERTGALRASVSERGADGNIFIVGRNSLTVGSEQFTAGWHQDGTVKMPARPIVGISWDRRSGILDRIRVYIKQQVEASGLHG